MATNEVVERDDIWLMDQDELHQHLIEAGFSEETSLVIKGITVAFIVGAWLPTSLHIVVHTNTIST